MAVQQYVNKKSMQLLMVTGHDSDGKALTKSYSYSSVKNEADDKAIYDTANAIAGLMSSELGSIYCTEKNELIDEE
jgi:hypothetical protein